MSCRNQKLVFVLGGFSLKAGLLEQSSTVFCPVTHLSFENLKSAHDEISIITWAPGDCEGRACFYRVFHDNTLITKRRFSAPRHEN